MAELSLLALLPHVQLKPSFDFLERFEHFALVRDLGALGVLLDYGRFCASAWLRALLLYHIVRKYNNKVLYLSSLLVDYEEIMNMDE